jgi:uncharacterized cupin superfamily protein
VDPTTLEQLERAQLQPEPIPQGWVLIGAPKARAAELSRSPDGARTALLSDCTSGEFLWRYAAHETVEILEGEAMVDDGAGPLVLKAGTQARFRAGTIARWRVPSYVKKVSWRRDPRPLVVLLAIRLARRLKTLSGAGPGDDADERLASRA